MVSPEIGGWRPAESATPVPRLGGALPVQGHRDGGGAGRAPGFPHRLAAADTASGCLDAAGVAAIPAGAGWGAKRARAERENRHAVRGGPRAPRGAAPTP